MDRYRIEFYLVETMLLCLTMYYTYKIRDLYHSTSVFCLFSAMSWINGCAILIWKHSAALTHHVLLKMVFCLTLAAGFLLGAHECYKRRRESLV